MTTSNTKADWPSSLDDNELDELDNYLRAHAQDGHLLLDGVHGLLSAIVVGPMQVLPEEWLPEVLHELLQGVHCYRFCGQELFGRELTARTPTRIVTSILYRTRVPASSTCSDRTHLDACNRAASRPHFGARSAYTSAQ